VEFKIMEKYVWEKGAGGSMVDELGRGVSTLG